MFRAYKLLGFPLTIQGELREHWGEPCYPARISVREVAGAIAEKSLKSQTYRAILGQVLKQVDKYPFWG